MFRTSFLLCFFLFAFTQAFSQPIDCENRPDIFAKVYGSNSNNAFLSMVFSPNDNAYYFAGRDNSSGSNDLTLTKMDVSGNVSWVQVFENTDAEIVLMDEVSNGDLIILYANYFGNIAYMMRIKKSGVVIFNKKLEFDSGANMRFLLFSKTKSHDYYIQTWYEQSNGNQDDIMISKLDENGVILWSRLYDTGGDDQNSHSRIYADENGGLVLSYSPTDFNNEGILKINSNGDVTFFKFLKGIEREATRTIKPVDDGYLIYGLTKNSNVLLNHNKNNLIVKLDLNGNFLWAKRINPPTGTPTGCSSCPSTFYDIAYDNQYYYFLTKNAISGHRSHSYILKLDKQGNLIQAVTIADSLSNPSYIDIVNGKLVVYNETKLQSTSIRGTSNYVSVFPTDFSCLCNGFGFNPQMANFNITIENGVSINKIDIFVDLSNLNTSIKSLNVSDTSLCKKCEIIDSIVGARQICVGDTIVLSLTGTYDSIKWSNDFSGNNVVITTPGLYSVVAYFNQCKFTDTVIIEEKQDINVNIGNDTTYCADFSRILSTGNPNTLWSSGQTGASITVNQSGTYWAQIAQPCGTTRDSITISKSIFTDNISAFLCLGDSLVLRNDSVVYTAGVYSVLIKNPGKCDSTLVYDIKNSDDFDIYLGNDTIVCLGNELILQVENNNDFGVTWSNGSQENSLTVDKSGIYWVIVNTKCSVTEDSISVVFEDCNCFVFVPNAFSPNNDKANDVFYPRTECAIENVVFRIFNRWGEKVFESTSADIGWNGIFKEKNAPLDTYVWTLGYNAIGDSTPQFMKGMVSLIK